MAAAIFVIPPTAPTINSGLPDASAARKRRREILSSHRHTLDDLGSPIPEMSTLMSSSVLLTTNDDDDDFRNLMRVSNYSDPELLVKPITRPSKRRKSLATTSKKPQMKYDPDVPMTKEEAAVWRREQRRKRNRESAALSRQRQRDKIGDLEGEIDDWKTQVESIMKRIKKLEDETGFDSSKLVPEAPPKRKKYQDIDIPEQSLAFEVVSDDDSDGNGKESKFVSPPTSPGPSPFPEDSEASPVGSHNDMTVVDSVVDQVLMGIGNYEQGFTDNMISRHAVKITAVSPTLPFLPKSEDSTIIALSPDKCSSGVTNVSTVVAPDKCNSSTTNDKVTTVVQTTSSTLDPIDSSLFPVKEEDKLPALLTDEENEDDFGEFLLDAVQWL